MPAKAPVLAEVCVRFPAEPSRLGDLHAALDRFWAALDRALPHPPDEQWRLQFATAAAEVATNVMRHAYPAGAAPGCIQLWLCAYPDLVEACFVDYGLVFTPLCGPKRGTLSDDRDDLDSLPEGGYGLALVRAAVDELDYSRSDEGTNVWRLVKRL